MQVRNIPLWELFKIEYFPSEKKNSWNWVIWFHIGFLALAMQTYFHDFFFDCQFFLVKTGLGYVLDASLKI